MDRSSRLRQASPRPPGEGRGGGEQAPGLSRLRARVRGSGEPPLQGRAGSRGAEGTEASQRKPCVSETARVKHAHTPVRVMRGHAQVAGWVARGVPGLCFLTTACDSAVIKVPAHGEPPSRPGHWESLATEARSCCLRPCPRKGGGRLRAQRPGARAVEGRAAPAAPPQHAPPTQAPELQLRACAAWQLAHAGFLAEPPARCPRADRGGVAVAVAMLSLNLLGSLRAHPSAHPGEQAAPRAAAFESGPQGPSLSLPLLWRREGMMVCGATGSPRAWSPRQALPSCRHPGGLTRTPAVACGELAAGQPLCRALSQHALPVSDPVSDPAPGRLPPSSSSGDLVCLRLTRWCSDSQEQNPKWCLGRHCAPSSTPSAWRGAGVPWAGMRPAGASPPVPPAPSRTARPSATPCVPGIRPLPTGLGPRGPLPTPTAATWHCGIPQTWFPTRAPSSHPLVGPWGAGVAPLS